MNVDVDVRYPREQIDELRDLLGLHDRSTVSVVALEGIAEIDDFRCSSRKIISSGDRAYVFIGPAHRLRGELRVAEDGSRTYVLALPSDEPPE